MKTKFKRFLASSATVTALLAASAMAKSVKVTISKTDDTVITGFVVTGDASSLVISQVENAPSGARFPKSSIKSIYWDEPEDWEAAWKLWTRRDYAAASKAFEDLAKTYANLAQIEDSYGAKAKYYQLECLRRTGQYSKLMDVLDEIKTVSLSDGYAKQIQLFNYWGHVGKKLWEPLKIITDRFEKDPSSIPSHTVPPTTPTLKGLDAGLMIQIAYMRGIATEMLAREAHKAAVANLDPQIPETQDEVNKAWAKVKTTATDYARVFTLTYMSDRFIAKEAMERSLAILKEDPTMKDNYPLQKEAYALASFYKDIFGKGSVPAAYESFLKEPKPPQSLSESELAPGDAGGAAAADPAPAPAPEKNGAAAKDDAKKPE
ncbi:MAG: hypothetical protein ACR2RV_18165 [Verrucomicrobiales bacterium]